MVDRFKQKIVFIVGGALATLFVVLIAFTLGGNIAENQANKSAEQRIEESLKKQQKLESDKILSEDKVVDFLTQYYTKTELGENNKRLKKYMTDSAYAAELSWQELATNQVKKDSVINYVFQESEVFINEKTKEVIANVRYNVTYLSDVAANGQQFKNKVLEEQTVKLTYANQQGKLLVSKMTPWQVKLKDLQDGGEQYIQRNTPTGGDSATPSSASETAVGNQKPAAQGQVVGQEIQTVAPETPTDIPQKIPQEEPSTSVPSEEPAVVEEVIEEVVVEQW